jgi:hypothetical protein
MKDMNRSHTTKHSIVRRCVLLSVLGAFALQFSAYETYQLKCSTPDISKTMCV